MNWKELDLYKGDLLHFRDFIMRTSFFISYKPYFFNDEAISLIRVECDTDGWPNNNRGLCWIGDQGLENLWL